VLSLIDLPVTVWPASLLTPVIEPEGAVVLLDAAMSHTLQFMSARQMTPRCRSCPWGKTGARKMRGDMPSCYRSVQVGGVIETAKRDLQRVRRNVVDREGGCHQRYSKFYFVRAMKARFERRYPEMSLVRESETMAGDCAGLICALTTGMIDGLVDNCQKRDSTPNQSIRFAPLVNTTRLPENSVLSLATNPQSVEGACARYRTCVRIALRPKVLSDYCEESSPAIILPVARGR
jgi:hypothetical protein